MRIYPSMRLNDSLTENLLWYTRSHPQLQGIALGDPRGLNLCAGHSELREFRVSFR